jgi:ribosomal protein L15
MPKGKRKPTEGNDTVIEDRDQEVDHQEPDTAEEGSPAQNEGDEEVAQAAEGEIALEEQSLEGLKSLVQNIQRDREMHQRALDELDEGLREIQRQIESMVRGGGRGRGRRSTQGAATGGRRSGGESGPQAVIRILKENGGEMPVADLRDKLGLNSPYSAMYPLQQKKVIERDGDLLRLVKQDEEEEESSEE